MTLSILRAVIAVLILVMCVVLHYQIKTMRHAFESGMIVAAQYGYGQAKLGVPRDQMTNDIWKTFHPSPQSTNAPIRK